ncbi:Hypothetical predicted protein [Paramuricea clavata]|uniref:Uncharacterized protein n=1 Tax=Paramuricea clavata TaxID=317549 RepID=A0A6S7FL97_PARCT|nr:Hypothetical predicted protein [Paramuricea clavata]
MAIGERALISSVTKCFRQSTKKHSKIVDLSLLPPCQSVLKLHGRRANFVAKIWKSSDEAKLQIPEISHHGWKSTGEIKWLVREFPNDVEELLFNPELDELDDDQIFDRDFESEEESDFDS